MHWSHRHARLWACAQHTRHRFILLADFCAGGLCLAVFVALSIGMLAFRDGAGVFDALLIGIASGALTLAAGQVAIAASQSLTLRVAIASAFAVPAAIAGYQAVFALSQIGGFAGLARGLRLRRCGLHWRRGMDALESLAKTRPLESGRAVERSQPVLRPLSARDDPCAFIIEQVRVDRCVEGGIIGTRAGSQSFSEWLDQSASISAQPT